MKTIQQTAKDQVCQLLHWTEDQMNTAIYEQALKWLNDVVNDDHLGIDALVRCDHFWAWWKNQWFIIDRKLLATLEWQNCPALERGDRYLKAHSAELMSVFPGTEVLEKSYGRMVQKVIDGIHQQKQEEVEAIYVRATTPRN